MPKWRSIFLSIRLSDYQIIRIIRIIRLSDCQIIRLLDKRSVLWEQATFLFLCVLCTLIWKGVRFLAVCVSGCSGILLRSAADQKIEWKTRPQATP